MRSRSTSSSPARPTPDYNPKLFTVMTRNPAQKRAGYYAELAYQYNGGLALMAAFEDSYQVSGPDTVCDPSESAAACNAPDQGSRNLTLHIEYPVFSWVQFFASLLSPQLQQKADQLQPAARRQHAHLQRDPHPHPAHPLPQRAHLSELAGRPGAGRRAQCLGRRRGPRARLRIQPPEELSPSFT